jgi:4-hydroxy-tetrahydrodipicolinate synthase
MAYFHTVRQLAEERDDWTLLVGPEKLTAEAVLFGAHGGVNGGANLFPRLFVELYEAAARHDVVRVAVLQEDVIQLGWIYQVGRHDSAVVKGLKCALACLGICDERMAEPFEPFTDAERERVRLLTAELMEHHGPRDRPTARATSAVLFE